LSESYFEQGNEVMIDGFHAIRRGRRIQNQAEMAAESILEPK
jgi:hypothetical protein